MIQYKTYLRFAALLCLAFLCACASKEGGGTREGSPAQGGGYKVGQPYQIKGAWYYPKEDYSYDETGIASWYGDDFHGQKTANGEIFNKNELTAAHHTLPMPSLARVTNLDNGRSIVVRVNDRGPFSGSRIIDVTQRAAQLLGFEKNGTAKVRVQVLADESKAIADAMRRYGGAAPMMMASSPNGAGASTINEDRASLPDALPDSIVAAPLTSVTTQQLEPPAGQQPLPPHQYTPQQAKEVIATLQPAPVVRQLPVTGSNKLYVQLGSFTKYDNASRVQKLVSPIGNANIAETTVKGVQFYRVRLGPVPDVATADAMVKKVTHAGIENARTVVD